MADDLRHRWRQGRRVGRTIYAQLGPEPSDADPLIGVMDTAELAAQAVAAVNARAALHEHGNLLVRPVTPEEEKGAAL